MSGHLTAGKWHCYFSSRMPQCKSDSGEFGIFGVLFFKAPTWYPHKRHLKENVLDAVICLSPSPQNCFFPKEEIMEMKLSLVKNRHEPIFQRH